MRRLLRSPLVWLLTAGGAVMAVVMTYAYLGAFLDPVGSSRDLPLALVVEDGGAQAGGRRLELGRQAAAALLRDPRLAEAVEWTPLGSRRQALAGIARNRYFAAVVLPRDYSRRLAALADPRATPAAATRVEVLTNPAAGSFARSAAQSLSSRAVMGVSMAIARRLVAPGEAPLVADRVEDAVRVVVRPAVPLGERSARGLAPFYFALMLALTGFLGAAIANIAVEVGAGHLALDAFAWRLHRPEGAASRVSLFAAKLVLTAAVSAAGGLLVAATAVGLLGMEADRPWALALFAVLGTAATAIATLVFLVSFGLAGALLGVLFTTIFGVPSSGGPYPVEMLPGFFRFLAEWLPLRYATDGTRALVFFDGRLDAGLGAALWVLAAYAAGGALISGAIAAAIDRFGAAAGKEPA